jgi:hypothetical protein
MDILTTISCDPKNFLCTMYVSTWGKSQPDNLLLCHVVYILV